MAQQGLKNTGIYWPLRCPQRASYAAAGAGYLTRAMDSTASCKVHYTGTLWWEDGGSGKTIDTVIFAVGAITGNLSGSDVLQVSLQTPDNASGRRGDGTADQSGTRNTAMTANDWNSVSLNTGGAPTYSSGDNVAVVFEWSAYSAGNFDLNTVATGVGDNDPVVNRLTTQSACFPIVLVKSGSTYGTLRGSVITKSLTGVAFNTGSAYDEYGIKFQVPFKCTVNGIWAEMYIGSSATLDARIWSNPTTGASALLTASGVNAALIGGSTANYRWTHIWFPTSTTVLTPGNTYGASIRATTANSVNLKFLDAGSTAYMGVLEGGSVCHEIRRDADTGNFDATNTTSMPHMGVIISALDDAAGGSGGAARHSLLNPGLN